MAGLAELLKSADSTSLGWHTCNISLYYISTAASSRAAESLHQRVQRIMKSILLLISRQTGLQCSSAIQTHELTIGDEVWLQEDCTEV